MGNNFEIIDVKKDYSINKNDKYEISIINEWIKWLSYEIPNMDKSVIKEHKQIASLFKNYLQKNCSDYEYIVVLGYMNRNIEDYMKAKLSNRELNIAYKNFNDIIHMQSDDIKEYIEQLSYIYNSLNMIDSYVLHFVIKYYYKIKNNPVNKIDIKKYVKTK